MAEGRDENLGSPYGSAGNRDPFQDTTRDDRAEFTAAEPRRGGSFWPALFGALIGGALVGGGGWYYLEYIRAQRPDPVQAAVDATRARVDDLAESVAPLGGRIDQLNTDQGAVRQGLDEQGRTIQELITGRDELRQRVDETAQVAPALVPRLDALEQTVRDAAQAARSGGAGAAGDAAAQLASDELGQRVAALERQREAGGPGGEALAELRQQIERLGAEQRQALDQRTGEIGGRVDELGQRVGTLGEEQARQAQQLSEVAGRLEPLGGLPDATRRNEQAAAAALAAAAAARESLSGDIQALRNETAQRTDALQARIGEDVAAATQRLREEDAARERLLTLSLTTDTLEEQVDGGAPFVETLDQVRQLANGDPVIVEAANRLAPVAESGVPSLDALTKSLPQPQNNPPRPATTAPDQPETWLGEAGRNLSGLVSVAPEGSPAAASDELGAARRALADGDLKGAIALMGPTAAAGDVASRDWLLAATRREQALASVGDLQAHVKSLAAAGRS